MNGQSPLDTVTRRAGAVRNGHGVAAHYGSPAGELAVCVRAVGLADRSDLVKLVLTGERDAVSELVNRVSGSRLAERGCVSAAGAWWCAASSRRVIALGEPASDALSETIRKAAVPGVEITDRSADWSAIALVGRATVPVLSAIGAFTDLRLAPPFGPATIDGARADLLLQSDRYAVMLVEPDAATGVWRAIERAGRTFGLSYVGAEAVRRFALAERTLDRTPVAATG